MSEPERESAGGRWWLVFLCVGIGVTVAGLGFYWWLGGKDPMATWGARGDAIAPFTSLLTALALFAAVISVRFQSAELQMQRREMADTREVQKQQERAQNRLAEAQERANALAAEATKAQERLAEAQEKANTLAEEAVQVQVRLSHQQDETRVRLAQAQEKGNELAELARQVQGRMKQFQLDANGLQERTNTLMAEQIIAQKKAALASLRAGWATLYAARRDYAEGANEERHRRSLARLSGLNDEIERLERELASIEQ